MACEYCERKGYVEIKMLKDNSSQSLVRPCPKCNDRKAYYRHIKNKYGEKPSKTNNTNKGEVVSLRDRRK